MRNIINSTLLKLLITCCVLLILIPSTKGQKINQERLNLLSDKYAKTSFPMLKDLLSIPNDAFYPADIEKNIAWCEQAFQKRSFQTTRISTETVPLLLAERKSKKAKKTVLIYLQLDGQPVDTTKWFQENPYKDL